MPTLTLITGGPGSGKTGEVVSRLSAMYEADPFAEAVVLVPTVRHGDQLRSRLVRRRSVALRLRVETVPQLSRGLAAGRTVPGSALLDELLAQTARREAERRGASYFRPIVGTAGFAALVGAAVDDLLAESVEPLALSWAAETTGFQALRALAAIFSAYVSELEGRGWVHSARLPLAAADAVRTAGPPAPAVFVDGFQMFRGCELALLEALAGVSDVVVTLDPWAGERAGYDHRRLLDRFPGAEVVNMGNAASPPSVAVEAGEAADREGEIRAIARRIKRRLTDRPSLRPSDFAVSFRQASPRLGMARQVFREYDLPLDPAAGERLGARPLGVWLRRLLALARDGWRLRDLVAVLSSGFVDLGRWDVSRGRLAQFARRGRQAHLWAGPDALGRIAASLRADADAREPGPGRDGLLRAADGFETALEELRDLLERPPGPGAEHARRLRDALFGAQPLIAPASQEQPGAEAEMDALQGYLRDLEAVDDELGGDPEPFDSFAARLERRLDAPAVLLRDAGGVLLAPMHTLHGLRFEHVAVGGLVEGEFPAPRATSALLDRDARRALEDAGLPLPPEPRLSEDELWASVRTRSDGVLGLWRSRLNDRGRPAAQSFYYSSLDAGQTVDVRETPARESASHRELAIACTRQWPLGGRQRPRGSDVWPVVREAVAVEQLRRSFRHAGRYEGSLSPGLVPRLTGEEAVWSATRLESYRTCAFQFFGRYALRLHELDEEMDSADAATRGSVVHDILQDALAPLVERGLPLTPETLADAISRLESGGREIWERAPGEKGFGRAALWRLDAEAVFPQLEMLLQREAQWSVDAGVSRIVGAEREMEARLPLEPPMRVTAKVDRLDAGDDFVVIVDYKSGRQIPRAHVMDGRRVQLQLYGYLAREEMDAQRVIARYAWLDPATRRWDLDSSQDEDADVLEDVVAVAREVRGAVQAGDFRVNPQVQPCPFYCAYRHVCRVNEYSRRKWWT